MKWYEIYDDHYIRMDQYIRFNIDTIITNPGAPEYVVLGETEHGREDTIRIFLHKIEAQDFLAGMVQHAEGS